MPRIFVRADDETVAADDLFGGGVPHDQLVVAVLGQIFGVDVQLLARAATRAAERDFAQAADLAHQRRTLGGREDINLVPGLLRIAGLALRRQFGAEQFPFDGRYDGFHLSLLHITGGKNTDFSVFPVPARAYFPKNTPFCVRIRPARGVRRNAAVRRRESGRPRKCGSAGPFGKTFRRAARASRY